MMPLAPDVRSSPHYVQRSRSAHASVWRRTLFVWLMLLALPGALVAQDAGTAAKNGEAPRPEAEKPAQSIAIAIEDIGVESERAKRMLADVSESLEPTAELTQLKSSVPVLTKRVEQQREESERVRAAGPTMLDIDHLTDSWNEIIKVLDEVQSDLRSQGAQVNAQIEVVRRRRDVWAATRVSAREHEVSEDVIRQIDGVEVAAAHALEKASARQATIIDMQSAVASNSGAALDDLKRIDAIRNSLVGDLLTRDQPPVWSAEFFETHGLDEVGNDFMEHQRRERTALFAFWAREKTWVYIVAAGTALFALLMFVARNRIRDRVRENVNLEMVGAVFAQPIALALLISFFAAMISLDTAQRVLLPIIGTATLIPAIIVMRRLIEPALYPMLNAIAVVFFLSQARDFFDPLPLLARLIFLAEMFVFVLVSAWWLRPARLAGLSEEALRRPVTRLIALALRVVGGVATFALLADLAGYGSLAKVIGWTLVVACYAAIVLYGAARGTEGLVALALATNPLNLLGMVRRNNALVLRRIMLGVNVAAAFFWVRAVLRSAELWDDAYAFVQSALAAELPLREMQITVGDLVASGLTFWFATLASRFIRFALAEDVFSRVKTRKGRPYAISALLHYVILLVGFFLAVAALGFDANRFTLLAGAFGVGIGFGLQNIVNNFTSGLILLTERPIEVGDTISMADVFGEVERIGIRSSTVRTWQGAEVIVPNADLIALQVTNWTLSDRRRRLEIPVGVAYGTDPQRVLDLLVEVAKNGDDILSAPEPYALFLGFGDSSLDFELRAWTDDFDRFLTVKSRLTVAVEAAIGAAGITIPFPQRDLHVQGIIPDRDAATPQRATEEEPGSDEV